MALKVPQDVSAWVKDSMAAAGTSHAGKAADLASYYTEDCNIYSMGGAVSKGREEFIASLSKLEGAFESLEHIVDGIYTTTEDWSDIILRGRLKMVFKSGNQLEQPFASQITLVKDASGALKGSMWNIFCDSAPVFAAMMAK